MIRIIRTSMASQIQMTSKEIAQLTKLLKKLKKERKPGERLPFPVWAELALLVPLPAVEVILTQTGKDFL